MKDWLQSLGFPDNPINEDAIVVLMDPDQLIMRPFRNNDFSNTEWLHIDKSKKPRTRIEHGAPMGQRYGFSLQWLSKVNMKHVAGPNDLPSPVETMDTKDANAGYVVGPPYIATARDMFAICDKWCEFAPRVHGKLFDYTWRHGPVCLFMSAVSRRCWANFKIWILSQTSIR